MKSGQTEPILETSGNQMERKIKHHVVFYFVHNYISDDTARGNSNRCKINLIDNLYRALYLKRER
jgi:hypothetical protein